MLLKKIFYDVFDNIKELFAVIWLLAYSFFLFYVFSMNYIIYILMLLAICLWLFFIIDKSTNNKLNKFRGFLPVLIHVCIIGEIYASGLANNNFIFSIFIVFFEILYEIFLQLNDSYHRKYFIKKIINLMDFFCASFFTLICIDPFINGIFLQNIVLLRLLIILCYFSIVVIICFIGLSAFFPDNKYKVKFIQYNLDIQDINKNRVYCTNKFSLKQKHYNIIKVDLSELFSDNNIEVVDGFVIKNMFSTNEEMIENKRNYFYLYLTNYTRNITIKMNLKTYNKDGKEKRYKLRFDISFANEDGLSFVTNYKMSILGKYFFSCNYNLNSELMLGEYNRFYLAYNMIYIKENSENYQEIYNTLNDEPICSRKWILHNDKFGNGKSILDKILVNSAGYAVKSVSSWESGYDEDFIRAIYNKLQNHNAISKMVLFALITVYLLALVTPLLKNFVKLTKYFLKLMPYYDCKLAGLILPILFIILGMIIIIIGFNKEKLNIFIFKKDGTKLTEDIFVCWIGKKLLEKNMMLIIEDVDRLDEQGISHVFSKLSLLNNSINANRYLGIISCSKRKLKQSFTKDNALKANNLYKELNEKAIGKTIKTSEESNENKRVYLKNIIDYLINNYSYTGNDEYIEKIESISQDLEINNLKLDTMSFRKLKSEIYYCLAKIEKIQKPKKILIQRMMILLLKM